HVVCILEYYHVEFFIRLFFWYCLLSVISWLIFFFLLFCLFFFVCCFFFFFFVFFFFFFFFFFSSRRRHTRSKRDWSSDVCSSDLPSVFSESRYGNTCTFLITENITRWLR